jgi:type IV pilus assembly protein PilM
VAIHKETIARYQKIAELARVHVSFFEIEIFSTVRATLERGLGTVAIIDVGFSSTKLYLVEHGVIRRSHNVNKGTGDITHAIAKSMGLSMGHAEELKRTMNVHSQENSNEEIHTVASVTLRYIFTEVSRMVLDFEKKTRKPINKILFTGGGALLGGLLDFAREHFDIEVEVANPFKKVETPAVLQDLLFRTGPEFSVAIGIALRKLEELP